MNETLKQAFIGTDGKLRPFLRAVIYYVVGTFLLFPALDWLFELLGHLLDLKRELAPAYIGLGELRNFSNALVCTAGFALYERRRVDGYGLPIDRALFRQTLAGTAAGVLTAGAVALGMLALGGMQIKGFATSGGALIYSAWSWLVASFCVGIAEEFWFRSYLQQTLWKSIGFWPASIVIALIFAAEHYFFKSGENVWDVITLVALSLLLSYSMLRTGTLWFAVGFHFAFDYLQLFVIGTPNGSLVPVGRLLDVQFDGPTWLTGGVLGTEASFLMYPAIALLWLYVWRRYRANPSLRP
jgi:membrane protease YdiL (CAAX protease family)